MAPVGIPWISMSRDLTELHDRALAVLLLDLAEGVGKRLLLASCFRICRAGVWLGGHGFYLLLRC